MNYLRASLGLRPYGINHPDRLICLFLILITLSLYWQVRGHEFIFFDDPQFVFENVHIQRGFNLQGLQWAFSGHFLCGISTAGYWAPVVFLSHMLDFSLYGPDPGGHHITNVLIHAASAALLFALFRRMTGAFWRSAAVAALFAIHPLNVESVAWVVERKGVLSGFFAIWTIHAYIRYTERPSIGRFASVFILFALTLMTKITLVALPFALLLLDYWPLKRAGITRSELNRWGRLFLEKGPLLFLAVVSSVQVILYMKNIEGLKTAVQVPFSWRISNAMVTYAGYVDKACYPRDLAVFYLHPGAGISIWALMISGLLLMSISALAVLWFRRYPFVVVGWLWYLGMFTPMIGIVQVAEQATADRYTYIPSIGLFIIASWGTFSLTQRFQNVAFLPRLFVQGVFMVLSGTAILLLLRCTWIQVGYWRDSETLFEHSLRLTGDTPFHNNLGVALCLKGRFAEGILHFEKVRRLRPDSEVYYNLGNALGMLGRNEEAVANYLQFLRMRRRHATSYHESRAHCAIADHLLEAGKCDEAMSHYKETLKIDPNSMRARCQIARILVSQAKLPEAIEQYVRAIPSDPLDTDIQKELADVLCKVGRYDAATALYLRALQIQPDLADVRNNLGNALASIGRLDEAIRQHEQVLAAHPQRVETRFNLAVCLARQNRFPEAISEMKAVLTQRPDFQPARQALKELLRPNPRAGAIGASGRK